MSNALERAEAAFQQGNWSSLHQRLQQLLVDRTTELSDSTTARLLELAIAVLEAGDFQDRWDIAKLLPAFGDRAIAPLLALLQDDEADLEARWFTARILGSYSHPDVVRALMNLLQTTSSEELSSIAAESLATLGTAAIAALTDLIAQDNTRLFAVRSLAHIRHSETIAPLLTVVTDPDPSVRAVALRALGSFHDPRVLSALVDALYDEQATVRQAAVEELGFCNDLTLQLDLVQLLSNRLQDVHSAVCSEAAIALGRLGTDAAADALFAVLQSPQTPKPLQLELVWSLARIGSTIALEYLQQALSLFNQPASMSLYQAMIVAVGRWETVDCKPQAAQILIAALDTSLATEQPTLRQTIAIGLGALGQLTALETLIQLLADEEMSVRLHAIAALKALDAQTAHQQLQRLAHSDLPDALKRGVAIAIREW
ncbi:MAG: HEAT repeat domain-containing protein [Tildeniella nuda ZEHNDER 1965/U140]|jgi:HEAT repeat protein|nr:HEAT repeat domain-containing protein [Tildeniella nuda ZEHNDER 1965/U140]